MPESTLNKLFFSSRELSVSLDLFLQRRCRSIIEHGAKDAETLSLMQFQRMSSKFIAAAIAAIRDGDYIPLPARKALVAADKLRTIYRFEHVDAFLLGHLARTLHLATEKHLSPALFSFRKGLGNLAALREASRFFERISPPCYVGRRDITRFGEQMDHRILTSDFAESARPSTALLTLFHRFCRFSYYEEDGGIAVNSIGLPTGTHLQLLCGNLYLRPLDEMLAAERDALYLRFGDDILLAHQERGRFLELRELLDRMIVERKLEMSPQKSADLCLAKPHQIRDLRSAESFPLCAAFEYLGSEILYNGKLRAPAVKLKKIKKFLRQRLTAAGRAAAGMDSEARAALLCRTAADLLRASVFRDTNPVLHYINPITDPNLLRQLDRWIALTVLRIAAARGFSQANFRRVSYKKMRLWGLPSTLHLRRIREL